MDDAAAMYADTIVLWHQFNHESAVAHQLESIANIGIAQGKYAWAAHLLGCALETRVRLDAQRIDPREIEDFDQAMEQLNDALGEPERDRFDEGRMMSLDEAVQLALEGELN